MSTALTEVLMKTNQLIKEMADLIRFHELEKTDFKAVELLVEADSVCPGTPTSDDDIEQWLEDLRMANIVETCR